MECAITIVRKRSAYINHSNMKSLIFIYCIDEKTSMNYGVRSYTGMSSLQSIHLYIPPLTRIINKITYGNFILWNSIIILCSHIKIFLFL